MTALSLAAHVIVGVLIGAAVRNAALLIATRRKDTQ